ncbi:PLP-dependent aminotransferase family protein [Enterovirga sp. CN4-39]|uniref:aminotransferase-like domain-containing protein n=1 Tax=Enterovirga sp. CN4-39 TaxID=3400910 RepID=UPI003BFC959D
MSWTPQIAGSGKPKYLALVDELEADIASGRLREGDRLPPQREIASRLGVTIATVTRAFGEAGRRGLISTRTGSGTFVRALGPAAIVAPDSLDLSLNTVPAWVAKPFIEAALRELSLSAGEDLFGYQPVIGLDRHRRAMAAWFGDRLPASGATEISLTHGAQQGLAACFAALVRPGDTVLSEQWTYTGIRRLAAAAHVTLAGVDVDCEGMRPDALEAGLERTGARVVICSSVVQNPTTATMSAERRRAIVAVCRAKDVILVEDDILGRLSADAEETLAALAPERVIYLTSVSKIISPGLRLGLLASPPHLSGDLREKLVSLNWTAPSFFAELFARMAANGQADGCVEAHRQEISRRLDAARELLGPAAIPTQPSYHLWLPVPEGWRLDEIVADLQAQNVRVSPSSNFQVDAALSAPAFVRVSLGAVEDFAQLTAALRRIASVWSSSPRLASTII